jgi:hypothetical protein
MNLPVDVKDATLSHCWGSAAEAALWRAVVASPEGAVSMATAPQILHDVALLLSQLGISYLWVDALCIDQDSETDWLIESSKMGQIYSNGYLNISAVAANNATESLFPGAINSANLIMQVQLQSHMREVEFSMNPTKEWLRQVEHAALSRRGWVMQERLLSSRIVHFGEGEVFWECVTLQAPEITPSSKKPEDVLSNWDAINVVTDSFSSSKLLSWQVETVNDSWHRLVEQYSSTNLTKPTDKIVAIAGLADRRSTHLKVPHSSYTAGLWKDDLVLSLLWVVQGTHCYPERAPSWSWVRWDGFVTFTKWRLQAERHAHIKKIVARHSGDPLISSGPSSITIQAPLSVFNTNDLKQSETMDVMRGIPILDTQNMAIAKIPNEGFQFDDSSYRAREDDRNYFGLLLASEPRFEFAIAKGAQGKCYGLILAPTGRKKGQFERVGHFTLHVTAIEQFIAFSMDPSNVPNDMYNKYDPEEGFEVEIV